ncbi:heavy metal-associated isoprenylated plant protein 2 [Beta vulgaris subsp. vulgaris]|uniref:heavy metal-associated isoprenylated plant protein 2 n=1 Tax=Beta vulgaris subsp. vulgaris TaxID=3555 RepID=UPI002036B0D7|nr:heavy metal-associated isoprenylated plant protein 2 [Beta vulgaris subsp. vulgaris]
MVQKTVLKVDVSCERCKQEVFEVVSKVEGVNKIEADIEKGTIAVIGDADPYAIITRLRKAGKSAQFVTVGPPPKPEEKKPDPKCPYPYPYSYSYPYPNGFCDGRPIAMMSLDYQDPPPLCSIM